MKRRLLFSGGIIFALAFLLGSCEKNQDFVNGKSGKSNVNDIDLIAYVIQPACGSDLHAVLFAGKNSRVGEVVVSLKGDFLNVAFSADEGWAFSETHLSVTNTPVEIPSTESGNPMIGLFRYSTSHNPAVTGYTYNDIPLEGIDEVYILAHAVASPVLNWETSLETFSLSLPETAVMSVEYPYAGSTSYLKTTITGGGILDGTYDGWCIDIGNVIYNNLDYQVRAISSYDPLAESLGLVDKPQNLDLVNWIINRDYPGKAAPDQTLYTYGDVQRAIWTLLEDNISESGLGSWSQSRVNQILGEAEAGGENFVPQCGGKIAIILLPVDLTQPFQVTIAQIFLTEYPSACKPELGSPESAWAAGYDFGGSNWAKYFTFCVK